MTRPQAEANSKEAPRQAPETNPPLARRSVLRAGALTMSAAVLSCGRQAAAQSPAAPEESRSQANVAAGSGLVSVKPLPFDPTSLSGLSERLLVSHHDNNYAGAVRKLNSVEKELNQLAPDAPAFLLGALQAQRLTFENSVILHESYFDNLGGNGDLGPKTREALTKEFGDMASFEARFTAVAKSLAGGSGWTLLTYHLKRNRISIDIAADHSQTCADSVVLLALDMYEHSYHMDFGTGAARYVDAFMRNVEGEVVERRFERAIAIAQIS